MQPEGSAVLVEARSTAGRISFGTQAIEGYVCASRYEGVLLVHPEPFARLEVDLRTLRSGNAIYDAELAQRLNTRRFPWARVELETAHRVGDRFQVAGPVTIHGETRIITGSVSVSPDEDGLRIQGEHVFDIRDFEIAMPSVLMLRIYPDVRIFLALSLRPETDSPGQHRKDV